MTNKEKVVQVAAAVIEKDNHILIAKRPDHTHQGGLWEFPGGKIEKNESPIQALQREIDEELGIKITQQEPLIKIRHDYPDKSVLLDVWKVTNFTGTPEGKEGQPIIWVEKSQLANFEFPAANQPIIQAATLPHYYLITPEPDPKKIDEFLSQLDIAFRRNISLAQLRVKNLNSSLFNPLYRQAAEIAQENDVTLYVNCDISTADKLEISHVHLTSQALAEVTQVPSDMEIAASCHNANDILKSHQIGANFIVLSCVKSTASHPDTLPIGWKSFETLCLNSKTPVFALGGLNTSDLSTAKIHGAQGIAGISTFWPK